MITKPKRIPTGDFATDRAMNELQRHAVELSEVPMVDGTLLEGVLLHDGTVTKINHTLGRRFRSLFLSPPLGPVSTGRIERMVNANKDEQVWLKATGFGAEIVVDIWII